MINFGKYKFCWYLFVLFWKMTHQDEVQLVIIKEYNSYQALPREQNIRAFP